MSTAAASAAASLVREVALAAREAGAPAWLVGGAVRDELLARPVRDVDVAVEATGERLARFVGSLAEGRGLVRKAAHERFGTATFETAAGLRLDVAATRRETYPRPAALPVVTTGVPITEDLRRRDFTIHAMARPVGAAGEGELLDPLGGARDLRSGVLRLLHAGSLVDDPTRIFRAAHYAARLGFAVSEEFAGHLAACRAAGALAALSPDRLRRALGEVLAGERAGTALGLLARWGVLSELAAGLEPPPEPLPAGGPERWCALFSPLADAQRAALAARLNFSRALRRAVGLK